MRHEKIRLMTMILCFLIALAVMPAHSTNPSEQASKRALINTQNQSQDPPINVTFRLLAIEGYYGASMTDDNVGSDNVVADQPMKSAQYLITTLLGYNNWQNKSDVYSGFRYTTHIHLLSADPNASLNFPSYYRGTPTKGNVTNEIQNFLAITAPGESNNFTIRILYYCGHSNVLKQLPNPDLSAPWLKAGSFYLELGKCGSDPSNASDPLNPTDYQELWDHQLNATLSTGDLSTNNCTLIILDSCHSGQAINTLQRAGRVIMTACNGTEVANGWLSSPKSNTANHWSWFTGQDSTNSWFNGTTQTPWPGGIGIIGAIKAPCDRDKNGWATADEIFGCLSPYSNSSAYRTTINYTYVETSVGATGNPSGLGKRTQTPCLQSGVMGAFIPLVQYNSSKPFPYNGFNYYSVAQQGSPDDTWPSFHSNPSHTGDTANDGPNTPNVLWAKTGFDTNASVTISAWEAIVATKDGVVHGLDLTTGSEIWRFTAESQIIATPAWDKDVIYVATLGGGGGGGAGGILRAISEPTGRVLWNWTAPTGVGFYASPVVADGRVFAATYSQNPSLPCGIYAFNQTTGSLLWGLTLGSPIKSSPAIRDGRVCVATTAASGTQPATLYVLAESSGTPLWSYSFGLSNVISSPAVAAGLVVVGCMGGGGGGGAGAGLYAFPESGGTWVWRYLTSSPVSSSPAVDEKRGIIVGCSEGPGGGGAVFALTLVGSLIWTSPPESVKMSSPAISGNGLVYVGTADGKVLSLYEATGAIAWSYTAAGSVTSSAAISEDHVFIGTTGSAGSTVYSFGPAYPDIIVTSARSSKAWAVEGEVLSWIVNVTNNGDVAQTFNVTLYLQTLYSAGGRSVSHAIETLQVTLAGRSSTTVTFGDDLGMGDYVFGAYACPVKYETSTLNNYCFGSNAIIVGTIAHLRAWGLIHPVPI